MTWKKKINELKKGKKSQLSLSDLEDRPNDPPVLISFVNPTSIGFSTLSVPDGVNWEESLLKINLDDGNQSENTIVASEGNYQKLITKNDEGTPIHYLIISSGVVTDGEALVSWLEDNFNNQPGWLLSPFVEHEAPTELYTNGPKGFIYTFIKPYNNKTANVVELRSYDNGAILYSMSVITGEGFEKYAEAYEIDLES